MTTPSYFYSPASGGFYLEGLHESIPEDAIVLTETAWAALIDGIAQGASVTLTGDQLALQMPEPEPESPPDAG